MIFKSPLLGILGLVAACWAHSSPKALPPSCSSNVYCQGPLLHAVQMARLFPDSKTFVDLRMIKSENETLADFDELVGNNDNITYSELEAFVDQHFMEGQELMNWTPPDFNPEPDILNKVRDPAFRQFLKDLVAIWPNLARKVSPEVELNPDRYSLVSLPNGFIIPGGRFKEIYYWDSFWIIEGVLLSGMTETARGMIENFLHLVKTLGHIPNGSRVYYAERSQPPLLTAMAAKYVMATQDLNWLNEHIGTLEQELEFWLENRVVEVEKDGKKYSMLRYFAQSTGPRPESYREDFMISNFFPTDERKQDFYIDVKSAAESGWDFSARWFINSNGSNVGNLTDLHTRRIIPVELNAMYCGAVEALGNLFSLLSNNRAAKKWWSVGLRWRQSIDEVLWNDEDGIWYDYDIEAGKQRRYFYPTNIAPLWAKCVDTDKVVVYAPKVIDYMKNSPGLAYPGGIPASLDHTGEQWDFPNAWPPLQSILIQGLENTGHPEGQALARDMAQMWVRANHRGFKKHEEMFEKYDAEYPGEYGGGGEYIVQSGFGWTNGVIFELLNQYGDRITSEDALHDQNHADS